MPVPTPAADTRWRCVACGNLTRFDVVRTQRVREFVHADLAGDPAIEETEALSNVVEHVTCRWCGAVDQIELVPRPASGATGATGATERPVPAPAVAAPGVPAPSAPGPVADAAP